MGDIVCVEGTEGALARVRAHKDGYAGLVPQEALCPVQDATHRVAVPAGHAYTAPDIKSPEAYPLYFGAKVTIVSHMPKFYETVAGHFIPKPHLRPLERLFSDPVTVAQMLFGAPYLWGGNAVAGIDCSGLVQAGCLACGIACPGDSGPQEAALGTALPEDAPAQRGDLLFWRGHVAWVVDPQTLIHANAHHMAVAYEPMEQAVFRIEAQGDGPVTSRRRLSLRPRLG